MNLFIIKGKEFNLEFEIVELSADKNVLCFKIVNQNRKTNDKWKYIYFRHHPFAAASFFEGYTHGNEQLHAVTLITNFGKTSKRFNVSGTVEVKRESFSK